MTLWWLGHIAQEQGDFTTALAYLQESFEILQRIKSPDAQAVRGMIDEIRTAQRTSINKDSSNGIISPYGELINTIRELGIGY